jgi:hypothetical protein
MAKFLAADLRKALDFKLSEVLRFDLILAGLGAVAVAVAAYISPTTIVAVSPWFAASAGVAIGAVIAGLSVLVAFLDQPFLRKLRAIQADPVTYLAPFMFTAVIGVFAVILLTATACFTATAPAQVFVPVAALAGFSGLWTLLSLIPGLDTLVQIVHLKIDAIDVPDDIGVSRRPVSPASPRSDDHARRLGM